MKIINWIWIILVATLLSSIFSRWYVQEDPGWLTGCCTYLSYFWNVVGTLVIWNKCTSVFVLFSWTCWLHIGGQLKPNCLYSGSFNMMRTTMWMLRNWKVVAILTFAGQARKCNAPQLTSCNTSLVGIWNSYLWFGLLLMQEEGILKGQELDNAVSDTDYSKAIQLAFELRRPHTLFDLFAGLCR